MTLILRKQTVFLVLAAVSLLVCSALPLADYEYEIMGQMPVAVYNLYLLPADGTGCQFVTFPLFLLLLSAAVLCVVNIFGFNNRIRQARYCLVSMLITVGWCLVLAAYVANIDAWLTGGTLSPRLLTLLLPVASLILQFMAYKSIMADERLVRAADRIR